MITINQNNAIQSYESALIPKTDLIDGRSDIDRLGFMVDFASLINFYDKRNKINGNWQPFLLKDPVILVASIAKAPFKRQHGLFVNACLDLYHVIHNSAQLEPKELSVNQTDLARALNDVFYSITNVYRQLEYWTRFMHKSPLVYNLKTYTTTKIKESYGALFWAVLAFQEYLVIQNVIKGISPVIRDDYKAYHSDLWKVTKGKEPFWEVLGLYTSDRSENDETFQEYVEKQINENGQYSTHFLEDIHKALKTAGDLSYSFFKSVVDYASVEYNTIILKKDNYPDTLLIRTFVDLMTVYKDQINGLSKKHLDFYYHEILKQKLANAEPDQLFACADLSFADGTYTLKANTKFLAGDDKNDQPIVLASETDTSLNPASITKAYTLSKSVNNDKLEQLNLNLIEDPSTLKIDENGKIQSWKTFGTEVPSATTSLSLVVASPMLYLSQAIKRTIRLRLTFKEAISEDFFQDIKYALSTDKAWFPVVPDIENPTVSEIDGLLKELVHDIEDFIMLLLRDIDDIVIDICQLFQKTLGFVSDFFKDIYRFLENVFESEKGILNALKICFEGIWQILQNPKIDKAIEDIIAFIRKIIATLPPSLYDILKILFDTLKNGSIDVFEHLLTLGNDIKNKLRSFGNNLHEALTEIGELKDDKVLIKHLRQSSKAVNETLELLYERINDHVTRIDQPLKFQNQTDQKASSKFKAMVIKIELGPEDPAIVAFEEHPEQLDSPWPMFKMDYNVFEDLANPPLIEQLQIDVEVEGVSNVVLSNDFGALDPKKPFQLLGVTAEKDQSFYLGSNELFSKPLMKLDFSLQWDNLPIDGFQAYYKQYNAYLNHDFDKLDPNCKCKDNPEPHCNSIYAVLLQWFEKYLLSLIFSKRNKADDEKPDPNNGKDEKTKSFFNNESFEVGFAQLSNNQWLPFNQNFSNNLLYQSTIKQLDEPSVCLFEKVLKDSSDFKCGSVLNEDPINLNPNPWLQLNPLEFTDTVSDGFLRMQLNSEYGFGMAIYPPMVSQIAIYNAEIIAKTIVCESNKSEFTCSPELPPNLPYVPTAGTFTANYKASIEYDFTSNNLNYPIACFYYTPFKNYKVYDNNSGLQQTGTVIGSSVKDLKDQNVLPLYPAFKSKGQLFLELEQLIAPNAISLYFELTRNLSTGTTSSQQVSYLYLDTNGWQKLELLSDGTNNISCSGIITVNMPTSISKPYLTFPSDRQWLSLSVKDGPDGYSETSFLKTNGFKLVRTGQNFLEDADEPKLAPNTITGPEAEIPQIESLTQPFPSFGGKAKETHFQMDKRTSTRLRFKDRIIASEDYFRTIQLNFMDIFFSKVVYNRHTNITDVLVVKRIDNWKDPNAFLPLVSNCKELDILSFLEYRASSLINLNVSNFEIKYVKVIAEISVADGYSLGDVAKSVNRQLHIFLSPWIQSTQDQIKIDTGLNTSEISSFLKRNKAIGDIKKIQLKIGDKSQETGVIIYDCLSVQNIKSLTKTTQLNTISVQCKIIDDISQELIAFCNYWLSFGKDIQLQKVNAIVKKAFDEYNQKITHNVLAAISDKIAQQLDKNRDDCSLKAMKTLVETIWIQLGINTTAYINSRTLLVPALDTTSIKFTSA